MVEKLSLSMFLAAPSFNTEEGRQNCVEYEDCTVKIKDLFKILDTATLVEIDGLQFNTSLTSANNIYFCRYNETNNSITDELMILTETIIDVKKIDSTTFKLVSDQVSTSITIRIL